MNNEILQDINFIKWSRETKFVTRKCNIFNDQLRANYVVGNEIIDSAEVV